MIVLEVSYWALYSHLTIACPGSVLVQSYVRTHTQKYLSVVSYRDADVQGKGESSATGDFFYCDDNSENKCSSFV